MKHTPHRETNVAGMDTATRNDAIDRILATDEGLVPSSGFVAAAMERVRDEAGHRGDPAPIAFPWKRVAPGLVLAGGVCGWGGWLAVRSGWVATHGLALNPPQVPAVAVPQLEGTGWVVFAFAVAGLAWSLSMRLVRPSKLL
jgi:hypothetical protein